MSVASRPHSTSAQIGSFNWASESYLESAGIKAVSPEESRGQSLLSAILDQCGGASLLPELFACLAALQEPLLPFKINLQLLGAADNPELRPFVLRLLLKRIVPSQLRLLEKLVDALSAASRAEAGGADSVAAEFGPLIFRSQRGPFAKRAGSGLDDEAAVRLLSILMKNTRFFFQEQVERPNLQDVKDQGSQPQRPRDAQLWSRQVNRGDALPGGSRKAQENQDPRAGSKGPATRHPDHRDSRTSSSVLQSQRGAGSGTGPLQFSAALRSSRDSGSLAACIQHAQPEQGGAHGSNRASVWDALGQSLRKELGGAESADSANPIGDSSKPQAFTHRRSEQSTHWHSAAAGAPLPLQFVGSAKPLPTPSLQTRTQQAAPCSPSLDDILTESRARLRKVLRIRRDAQASPQPAKPGARPASPADGGRAIFRGGKPCGRAADREERKRQLEQTEVNLQPWRPPGLHVHEAHASCLHQQERPHLQQRTPPASHFPGQGRGPSKYSSPRQCSSHVTRGLKSRATQLLRDSSAAGSPMDGGSPLFSDFSPFDTHTPQERRRPAVEQLHISKLQFSPACQEQASGAVQALQISSCSHGPLAKCAASSDLSLRPGRINTEGSRQAGPHSQLHDEQNLGGSATGGNCVLVNNETFYLRGEQCRQIPNTEAAGAQPAGRAAAGSVPAAPPPPPMSTKKLPLAPPLPPMSTPKVPLAPPLPPMSTPKVPLAPPPPSCRTIPPAPPYARQSGAAATPGTRLQSVPAAPPPPSASRGRTPPPPPPPKFGATPASSSKPFKFRGTATDATCKVGTKTAEAAGNREEAGMRTPPSRRLKQTHLSKFKNAPKGSTWLQPKPEVELDLDEITKLFQLVDVQPTNRLFKQRSGMLTFIDTKRASNIGIILSGIRMKPEKIKAAIEGMDLGHLDPSQLHGLLMSIPEDAERRDLDLYIQGRHPRHMGTTDPCLLAPVERYFYEIKDIPRLSQRIRACIALNSFGETAGMVEETLGCITAACGEVMASKDLDLLLSAALKMSNILDSGTRNADGSGIKLPSMLKLADVKASDKKTSLLKVILRQLEDKCSIAVASFLLDDVPNLKSAARVQIKLLNDCMVELEEGWQTVSQEERMLAASNTPDPKGVIRDMHAFCIEARKELDALKESKSGAYVMAEKAACFLGETFSSTDPLQALRVMDEITKMVSKAGRELHAARQEEAGKRSAM